MKNVLDLGKVLLTEMFDYFIAETENLPVVHKKYGTYKNIDTFPCWLEYKNEGNLIGSIAFSRNTNKHPILKDMVTIVTESLRHFFPQSIEINRDRVHFLRTKGNIPIHKDESGRNSCINIGIKNSSYSVTKFSLDGDYSNFDQNNESITLEDGHAYLLNTNEYHMVVSDLQEYRYLITYGFEEKFECLRKKFMEKE